MSEETIRTLITVSLPERLIERVKAVSPRLVVEQRSIKTEAEYGQLDLEDLEILYTVSLLPEADSVPRLKWIQFHYAGIDHVIGHPLLEQELSFTTMSGASVPQIAEFARGLASMA